MIQRHCCGGLSGGTISSPNAPLRIKYAKQSILVQELRVFTSPSTKKKPSKTTWRMRRPMMESRGCRYSICPHPTLSSQTSMREILPFENISHIHEKQCGSGN